MTPKQERAERERKDYEALAALRLLAKHIGLIPSAKVFFPSKQQMAERVQQAGGMGLVRTCLDIICDDSVPPLARAAVGIILECFIPDWREVVGLEVLGMVAERDDSETRAWRAAVLARDNGKCTLCGSTAKLHAHHIVRWADAPASRLVVSNGVTLCQTCHETTHSKGA
jgi:hypothetical protein